MNVQLRSASYNIAILLIFVLMAWTYLLRPIGEPDFFWHLKTGEWIWQHHSLPTHDPFTYTSSHPLLFRQLFIMQGYWLIQLLYHACVASFDLWGVLVVRLIFLGGFFWLFYTAFKKSRVNSWLSLGLILAFSIFFLENYALERPQVVTFIGVGLLLSLYRHIRDNSETFSFGRVVVLSGSLMIVWANSHGGVIVGQGILCLVLVIETALFFWLRNRRRYRLQVVFCFSAILGSFLLPNLLSTDLLLGLMGANDQSMHLQNYEYFSIYKWLVINRQYKLLLVILLFVASAIFTFSAFKKRNYVEICVFAIVWFFAFKHVRYVPIALVVSLLYVAWNYYDSFFIKSLSALVLFCAVGSIWMWTLNDFANYRGAREHGLINPRSLPVNAVNFLEESQIHGRIFNPINWGGYLIWRLSPHSKFYIDSRYLEPELIAESKQVSALVKSESGRPLWKVVMERDKVNIALLRLYDDRGKQFLLSRALLGDPEWQVVFHDDISVVFVRKTPI
jgi:hypothetical protein